MVRKEDTRCKYGVSKEYVEKREKALQGIY